MNPDKLLVQLNLDTGEIPRAALIRRYLSDLRGCFQDTQAYDATLQQGNPLLYTVAAVEPGAGTGDLHYGLGVIFPGRIGNEFFMTKGHLHAWREAAEVYIGLKGRGVMLLEDEHTGESQMLELGPSKVVYVPGHTAHRTMNVGSDPLVYLGIYPAKAGHDYGAIAKNNFRQVVVDQNGRPAMVPRK